MEMNQNQPAPPKPRRFDISLVYDLLLVALLVVGAYLRLVGLDWDQGQHLHPDERFLTTVETSLQPVQSLSEYWDTDNSTLNPQNRGNNFFVYGTLPIFLVRYVAEWLGQTGYSQVNLVGRTLSALADLGVVTLVYLLASQLYDRRVGIIAAAFSTFTVMQIQLSHYFATDTFLNLFTLLAVFIAVRLTMEGDDEKPFRWSTFLLFGAALGMAVASKLSTAPVAVVLPLAVFARVMKLPAEKRSEIAQNTLPYLLGAAFTSLLVFRIFQPYAFSGPGFFGLKPNPKWLENIASLSAQAAGDVDWPPSIQWARRPLWFSGKNMLLWGMGLPMGILAWTGFFWIAWRAIKGEWKQHAVLWLWTAVFFGWQSLAFNPTMRYQLPSYPGMTIFAAWAVVALWDAACRRETQLKGGLRILAAGVGIAAISLTAVWGFMFSRIYTRPVTRVAATTWIYQNLPGPLTLPIETEQGTYNQPVSFPYGQEVTPENPFSTTIMLNASGTLAEVKLKHVQIPALSRTLVMTIANADDPGVLLAEVEAELTFAAGASSDTQEVKLTPSVPVTLEPGIQYLVNLEPTDGDGLLTLGAFSLYTITGTEAGSIVLNAASLLVSPQSPYTSTIAVGSLSTITEAVGTVSLTTPQYPQQQTLRLLVGDTPDIDSPLAVVETQIKMVDGHSEWDTFTFKQPLQVKEGSLLYLRLENTTEDGLLTLLGTGIAIESPWDDGLPLRTLYDGYGGIYQQDLTLDMYADDNPAKLERFLQVLDNAEYLVLSSSRQWASTPRIPERYPLNVVYYRALLGCPEKKDIEWCYNVADVGMFEGQLGYQLYRVFQSDPSLGSFRINDQASEEAFTVYDHPKVFIFRKTSDYDPQKVAETLSAVDFDKVIRLTPKQAGKYKGTETSKDLLLPAERFESQQQSGTWSELFDQQRLVNRSGFIAFLVWYLAVLLLGLLAYPIIRWLLPNLHDRGYPLARVAGLLLLSYFSWLAGSGGLAYSQANITWFARLLVVLGATAAWLQRKELAVEFKQRWRYFLGVETLFLSLFLLSLLVRLGNPDLWHPYKGGEKPMDFAYFNAVLKSDQFPPYDPWYAGGYINYYYYGFVYMGTLVKLLGITPSVAYNLIIPTLFACLSLGAFSLGWNLFKAVKPEEGDVDISPWLVGAAAGLGTALLGNLGTLRMILRGYASIGGGIAYSQDAFFLKQWWWGLKGFFLNFSGTGLPYSLGDWYWIPSRVIPAPNDVEPITEFPWFTFIYADLHAHMFSLTLVVLALSWIMSVALGGFKRQPGGWWGTFASLLFGGLVIGVLRPTNTWDLYTFLALGVVALLFASYRNSPPLPKRLEDLVPTWLWQSVMVLVMTATLALASYLLFLPFTHWFAQGYTQVNVWTGTHTPTGSYLTHWGLFLFVIVLWMGWETRQWMAATPVSALSILRHNLIWLVLAAALLVLVILGLPWLLKSNDYRLALLSLIDVRIYWLVLPLGIWAVLLLLRPNQPDAKRAVLFMTGTALFLTLMVEMIVVAGDIGRMNTVFKFYLQAWVLFAVSAAAAAGWTVRQLRQWSSGWRTFWITGASLLVVVALLYPITATVAKIKDRMAVDAPHTLDGMDYMAYSFYSDQGQQFDLSQDYDAIRWMQRNVQGSPVIVEGYNPEYRWGSRYSIYTGLPAVLGWRWHQVQQRVASSSNMVDARVDAIQQFYTTTDVEFTRQFLQTYRVGYIIVGQLEYAYYAGEGLDKFASLDGILWQSVYHQGDTTVYEVLE